MRFEVGKRYYIAMVRLLDEKIVSKVVYKRLSSITPYGMSEEDGCALIFEDGALRIFAEDHEVFETMEEASKLRDEYIEALLDSGFQLASRL